LDAHHWSYQLRTEVRIELVSGHRTPATIDFATRRASATLVELDALDEVEDGRPTLFQMLA
jgi:hypothetical protein